MHQLSVPRCHARRPEAGRGHCHKHLSKDWNARVTLTKIEVFLTILVTGFSRDKLGIMSRFRTFSQVHSCGVFSFYVIF